ncbi:MAG TPA: choice-of-anchor tandem repeat GloVer-containing protein [Methylocella sp.]|nr:choice-of-anchor tandem repeat GloVer-containing protein [Methylocella sp.]
MYILQRIFKYSLSFLILTSNAAWSAEAPSGGSTPLTDEAAASRGFSTLYRFRGGALGNWPRGGVALDTAGNVYGTTLYGGSCSTCGVIYQLVKPAPGQTAWTYKVLHAFQLGADGIAPTAPLTIKGSAIYGTASAGANPLCGCGEVFSLTKSGTGWSYKILHRFNRSQGTTPIGGVLVAADGTLYGTASGGGAKQGGVLYKITPGGTFSVLHNFAKATGSGPQGELIFGKDGAIYGTTFSGGKYNQGAVFRITTGGAYSVLYHFKGIYQFPPSHDGAQPEGRLALGKDGTIYGTTTFGGNASGYGTAWSLTPSAGGTWTYAQLYIFGSPSNLPHSGLVIDAAGNLYGTAAGGGAFGSGTLYRLSPPKTGKTWVLTVLRSFKGRNTNGDTPYADIVLKGGALYGTNLTGGMLNLCGNGCGTVFRYGL